jgi:aminopeptidase-like protein
MYALAERLYPLPRSLTGQYVRETLGILGEHVPLKRYSVPSGTEAFDWTVPPEWNVESATLRGPEGLICSWEDNPLHLMFYSEPVDDWISREDLLLDHLHMARDAIPYVTSYYNRTWAFCVGEETANALPSGQYRVNIDASFDEHGQLDYADLVIPGEIDQEVMFQTYICHPNLANDNVSGMVVQTALAEWIASEPRRYTYRFIFCPETIGSLVYLADRNRLQWLPQNTVAGFVLNCLGDDRTYSLVHSKRENTTADRIAAASLSMGRGFYMEGPRAARTHGHPWQLRRGSDERQWCMPRIDMPVVRLSRSEHLSFPAYHTSADDLSIISGEAMDDSLSMLKDVVNLLEINRRWVCKTIGEPNLGSRGLYPTTAHGKRPRGLLNVLAWCDGEHDVLDICEKIGANPTHVLDSLTTLIEHGLVEAV